MLCVNEELRCINPTVTFCTKNENGPLLLLRGAADLQPDHISLWRLTVPTFNQSSALAGSACNNKSNQPVSFHSAISGVATRVIPFRHCAVKMTRLVSISSTLDPQRLPGENQRGVRPECRSAEPAAGLFLQRRRAGVPGKYAPSWQPCQTNPTRTNPQFSIRYEGAEVMVTAQ